MKVQKKIHENKSTAAKPLAERSLSKSPEIKTSRNKILTWLVVIVAATFFSYSPSLKNDITNWDDDQYVEKNPWLQELSSENVTEIFSTYYMGNYHPLAMLSLTIDYQIGGKDKDGNIKPFIFHFTNLALHIINTLLVFLLVFLLLSNFEIAVISALLFGLSTMHVESVAWISERKDVLYAMFFIASLIAYVYYIKLRQSKYYICALVLFVLSLFSKGQAVSLAVTLFAIDFLFGRKLLDKKVVLEKLPFLFLALIFGIIAIKAQQAGNAIGDTDSYAFYKRIGFAGYAFTQYLIKLLVPVGLSAINPYPDIINKTIPAHYWLFMIPALAVVAAFFYYLKRSKIVAFGIAFFIINIFLLLQLIPVGSAIWADRYSYIPSIGYYLVLAWMIVQVHARFNLNKMLIYSITGVYLVVIAFASFERTKVWENSMRLWDDTLEKSPKAVVAWNNRGSLKDKAKNHKEAIDDFTQAILLKPDYTHAFYNRGTAKKNYAEVLSDSTMYQSAIEDFDFALKLNHVFVEALHNRGLTKEKLSDFARTNEKRNALLLESLEDFDKTIALNPQYENALVSRGVLKGKLNRFDEAIADFNLAIQQSPDNPQAYANRGLAKDFKEDYAGALADFSKAIEFKPDFETAFLNRGITFRKLKNLDSSNKDLTEAIRLDSKLSAAFYFRGLNYIDLKNKELACADFQMSAQLGHMFGREQLKIHCNK